MKISIPLLLRRGATQSALLAAVLGVVVTGAVLLGTCALLLTIGQEAALDMALRRADPSDIDVEVAFRMADGDPRGVVLDATAVLTDALAPVDPVISAWLTSEMRPLSFGGASEGYGYVVEASEIAEHADLLDGRWPTVSSGGGPLEVAVPDAAARRLGLAPGSTLVLEELRDGTVSDELVPGSEAVDLVVVGTYAPLPDESVWDRDLLRGAAVDPTWELRTMMEQPPVTAYGPFVAAPGGLLGATVAVDRVSLVAVPDLAGLDGGSRDAVRAGLATVLRDVRDALGDRTKSERLTTGLARTITAAEIQQRVTGSAMLVVALLGTALAAAALALAGRLVTVRRNAEARLLAARGANRAQLVGQAAVESLLLALVAAALALPLTVVLYRWLSGLPPMADAGLTRDVGVTTTLALTVTVAALALAGVLVTPSVRAPDRAPRTRRSARGRVARSSVDALLVALAVVGYLQLRGRPFAEGGGPDPVLVAAPVFCLVAGAALALRIVPLVSRWAERRATRSRRLVVPLASWEIARRSHSTGAALLLVLAAAGATFSVSLGETWSVSAEDQADTQVGTDLAVGLTEGSTVAQARGLAALTGGDLVPVTDREVALGAVGDDDTALSETRLVAVDTLRADELLRGRLDAGSTWSELTSGLAPDAPVAGIVLPADADGVRLTVTGSVAGAEAWDMELTILPTVVVQTAGGAREEVFGWEVPLDGEAHELVLPLPRPSEGTPLRGGVQVVAVDLRVARGSAFDFERIGNASARLTVNATVAASGSTTPVTVGDGEWSASVAAGSVDRLKAPGEVVVSENDGEVEVAGTAALYAIGLFIGDADLVLHGFVPQTEVPVLINRDLADAVAAQPGDALSLDVGGATVLGRVVAIVPEVVALPLGADLLTDHDALSRASLGQGSLASMTDRWWVSGVADAEATAVVLTDAGLGVPTTRSGVAEVLRRDPLRIGLQMSLWLLVAAAGVLAVAGTVVQTAAALEARAVDVARLQGMGVPRRAVVAALLVEHGVVNLLVVVAGGGVGWAVSSTVGPLLVVASNGRAPVPSALAQWSWTVQASVLGVLVLACGAAVAPVAASLVRRATATHLRMDAAS